MSSPDRPVSERSLEEIDDNRWGDAPADASFLMRTVHDLRRLPVGSLDTEGLRALLSQNEGAETLVPMAIEKLRAEPLAEGDFYPGDLLAAVLKLDDSYWAHHPREKKLVAALVETIDQDDPDFPTVTHLSDLVAAFSSR